MDKFQGFKMLFKRQKFAESTHDISITSAYVSFSNTAMKQLGVTLGDKIGVAGIEEDDGTQKLLIAASMDDSSYVLKINTKVKRTTPLIFINVGKKNPDLKGNYYLKRYGSHESHEWWEIVKEKPLKKMKIF